ncbi:receptor-type tyrosine-protein phosphatase kappa-like isoform X10 [Oratosquilla oratoria]|uniref:receptor-type tyrosine-protein phosphatase kappa-like isoform X10 n=1 Tax=Oratosquilla oratoria TaxID=337810 RepID=UPI003F75BC02
MQDPVGNPVFRTFLRILENTTFIMEVKEYIQYNDTVYIVPDDFVLENDSAVLREIDNSVECCTIGEGAWIWFSCILTFVIFLTYVSIKQLGRCTNDKAVEKHEKIINKTLYAEEEKAVGALPANPIPVSDFFNICAQHRKYPILYKMEFQMGTKVEAHSMRHALKEANDPKNQNKKIIPYDYNRVVLEPLEDMPDSDYINASYVDSLLTPKAYIVAQGPNERTIGDFWRMVWQENTRMIVMLTKTFDFIKVMCVQYWPAMVGHHDEYSGIKVKLLKEEQLANFMIRSILLTKEGHPEERMITQFHYTEWPSHTQPFINALLEFRRRIRIAIKNNANASDGPTIVHCSDGAGRTGVYLACDANLEMCEEDGMFDIYGYLKKMRQARRGLIETVDQYKFVYDTLEELLICGYSFFPVSELSNRLKHKSMKLNGNKSEYQIEFEQICKMTPRFTIGDCAGGHRADNRFKNRNVLCVPPDNFRPYLTSFQGNSCTDYINSVFVDNYPPFWPEKEKSLKYGPVFTIDHVSHQHYQNIRSWVFRMQKKIVSLTELMAGIKAEPKSCQLFQLMCWPQGHKVPTSTNALVELMNMVERWRQRTGYGPVVVISPDGMSRAGVYCAANACIEQVIQHGEVDVFQAVKTVRRHRPQLINNMTEYKYCYDLVLHYVLHFLQKEATQDGSGDPTGRRVSTLPMPLP